LLEEGNGEREKRRYGDFLCSPIPRFTNSPARALMVTSASGEHVASDAVWVSL